MTKENILFVHPEGPVLSHHPWCPRGVPEPAAEHYWLSSIHFHPTFQTHTTYFIFTKSALSLKAPSSPRLCQKPHIPLLHPLPLPNSPSHSLPHHHSRQDPAVSGKSAISQESQESTQILLLSKFP